MLKRGKSVLALIAAALMLAVSGYAATGNVQGIRSGDRESQQGPNCKKPKVHGKPCRVDVNAELGKTVGKDKGRN